MQTMPAPAQKSKGAVALWIGGVLVVLGIVVGIVGIATGVSGMSDVVDGYQRVPVSGGGAITIDDTGTYRVFLERPGANEDRFRGTTPSFTIEGPDGATVPLQYDSVNETYGVSGRDGRKLGKFRADRPGTYVFRTNTSDQGSSLGNLAVGRKGPTSELVKLGVGLVLGGLLFVAGVILLIVGGVRRSRSRRSPIAYPGVPGTGWAAPPAGPPGWAPPPTGPAGWSPPPAPPPPPGTGGWAAPPPPAQTPPPPAPAPPHDEPWSPTPPPSGSPSDPGRGPVS